MSRPITSMDRLHTHMDMVRWEDTQDTMAAMVDMVDFQDMEDTMETHGTTLDMDHTHTEMLTLTTLTSWSITSILNQRIKSQHSQRVQQSQRERRMLSTSEDTTMSMDFMEDTTTPMIHLVLR